MKRISSALLFGILISLLQPTAAMAATADIACSVSGKFTVTDNVVVSHSGLTCTGNAPIPSGITAIENFAFYNESTNTGAPVTSVDFPSSLKTIGWGAFIKSRLVNINIPSSVTLVQNQAFQGVETLKNVEIAGGVGGEITELGYYVFNESSVESISLASGAFSYSVFTFSNARSLTSLVLPSWPTSIPEGFFKNSSSLTTMTIPDSVTAIGVDAFRGMTNLTSIEIGIGVTSIGANAFADSGLTSVLYCGTSSLVRDYVFPNDTKSHCPSDAVAKTSEQLAEEARIARESALRFAIALLKRLLAAPEKVSVQHLTAAEINGATEANIASINTELAQLSLEGKSDISQIAKVARKYEVLDLIASSRVASLMPQTLIEIGLIAPDNKSKSAITAALRKLPVEKRSDFGLITGAIADEMVKIQARKDRLTAAVMRISKR